MKSVWTTCHSLLILLPTLLRRFSPSLGQVIRAKASQLPVLEHSYGITYATLGDCISTLACCYHCAKDPLCRSFLYEPATRSCRLNSRKSEDPPVSPSWDVIYGQIEPLSDWLGVTCPSTACSSYPNTACYEGGCTCTFGLSYHYKTDTCVPDCNTMQGYGTNFTRHPMQLFGFDDAYFLDVLDVEPCRAACIDSTGFVCRSLEYFSDTCYLSAETVYTQPQAAEANEWSRGPTVYFLTRDCL